VTDHRNADQPRFSPATKPVSSSSLARAASVVSSTEIDDIDVRSSRDFICANVVSSSLWRVVSSDSSAMTSSREVAFASRRWMRWMPSLIVRTRALVSTYWVVTSSTELDRDSSVPLPAT